MGTPKEGRQWLSEMGIETHSKHTVIEEYRAPTDESVKLLNEFEEKARKNIIAKVHVADNTINGVAIWYTDHTVSANRNGVIHLKFTVNGKEYLITDNYDMYDSSGGAKNERELQEYLKNYMKTKVAKHILYHLNEQILKQLKGE